MWPGAELPLLVGTTSAPPAPPVPASESEAMALPPFGRGLDLIAGTIAGLGWWAMSWDAKLGIWQRTADQPQVLLDPDPMTTPWHYRMAAGQDLVIYGNHVALYGEMDWRTNRPGWLAPVPPEDVWLLSDASDPVAMLLGIPSWKLGLQGPSMTYQNVDQADIVWIQDAVDRWGQPMTAAFSKWLMPRGTVVRWDYAARQRADQKTTAETLKTY